MPAQPSYLSLNRHGTYYFRIVTPKPLRVALGLPREIRRSLKTDSLKQALRRARQYVARYEAVFDKVLNVVTRAGPPGSIGGACSRPHLRCIADCFHP
ncbi:MAG TPA: DUF6538 domain-containing protein [Pseudomonas sp.]|uniref:DUF6538 domain-containing protein n=1 Tax=Pseudomonas sp. TaxID=306 RepID=UPI002EDA226D